MNSESENRKSSILRVLQDVFTKWSLKSSVKNLNINLYYYFVNIILLFLTSRLLGYKRYLNMKD